MNYASILPRALYGFIAIVVCACSSQSSSTGGGPAPNSSTGRVLIIGMDGTRAEALDVATTPNLDALRATGSEDMNALTGDVSLSGPGWASMLSGVWCDKHGVVDNDVSWANSRFDQYPHVITRLKAAQPTKRAVSISHWAAINDEILCADERDDNCGSTDLVINTDTDAQVRDAAVAELRNGSPDMMFLQFDDIDHAGHGTAPASPPGGFCPYADGDLLAGDDPGLCTPLTFNPEYLSTLELTDGYIGEVLTALRARPNYAAENWLIVVSPDHGGGGVLFNQHGFPHPQDRRIFIILSGANVTALPSDVSIKIVDIAATVLHHLGIVIAAADDLDGQAVGLVGLPAYAERTVPSCYNPAVFVPDLGTR